MLSSRSTPLLLIGFGLLIALTAVSGLGSLQRARDTYGDIKALNERYRRTDRVLRNISSGIYMAGLLARDFLLDPSPVPEVDYRAQLAAERDNMRQGFAELQNAIRDKDKPQLEALRVQVEGYWDALGPLFGWTAAQKDAQSWAFLRREILPRRRAALSIAEQVANLMQANLDDQRREIDLRQTAMAEFSGRMLAFTVLLSLVIAGGVIYRMTLLERNSEEHRRRTEAAERQLRLLSRQLVQAQEAERKSLSRELHDEVGQMLTALRMELRSLQDLRMAPEKEFADHLEDAKHLAEQGLRSLRDIAMGLRPSMLDDLGLGAAVQWQARQFAKHAGVPVNVHVAGVPAELPDALRTCVYRVIQEALTNCARHAHPKAIEVSVVGDRGQLYVAVRDDGAGFDPKARGRGLGLVGMKERVRELGGELMVTSKPRSGTELKVQIPLTNGAAA